MNKKIIEAALLSCIISLMIACNPKKDEPVAAPVIDKEQIKKEIQTPGLPYAGCVLGLRVTHSCYDVVNPPPKGVLRTTDVTCSCNTYNSPR